MIGKNEETDESESNSARIKLIASKRKVLESNSAQIQKEITACFAQLAEALHSREKQLLRQAEAVYRQQLSLIQSNLEFLPPSIVILNEKQDLEDQIRRFGKIELSDANCIAVKDTEPYKVAEYQEANKDHVSFDKSIKCNEELDTQTKQCGSSSINEFHVPSAEQNASINHDESFDDPNANVESDPSNDTNSFRKSPTSLSQCDERTDRKPESSEPCCLLETTQMKDDSNHSLECITSNVTASDEEKDFADRKPVREHSQNYETLRDSYEHPKQVQEWLQQILVETEIEPMVHEVGQFSEISEARLCSGF